MSNGGAVGLAVVGVGLAAGIGLLLLSRRPSAAARGGGFGGGASRGGGTGSSWDDTAADPADAGPIGYPSWHGRYAPLVGGPVDKTLLRSGCRPDADGNIQCAPETMRADAERQLQASRHWPPGKPLDLATYTLARYMQSEVGGGTAEERVAVGEAAVNRARLRRQDVTALLLYTQPNRLYGQINVPGKGNVNRRWASTSRDPSVLTTLLADLVLSGASENVSRGADDQDGLEYKRYFPVPMDRILSEARSGKYWVGPIAGVDHWKTTLFRTYGHKPSSDEGRALIDRAREVFGNPVYEGDVVARSMRPRWPSSEGVA